MATINITKAIPPRITNLVITPAVGARTLTWDKHEADNYEVWYSNTNDVSGATFLAGVEANTYTASNLSESLNHFFWVRAVNLVGTNGLFTSAADGIFFNTLYAGVFENGSTSTSIDSLQAQVWYTTAAGVATSVGPSYFTTAVTNSTFGSEPWVNPANARVNDGVFATVTSTGANQDLLYKLSDLGVPNDAVVTGIQFTVNGKSSSYTASNLNVYLVNDVFSVPSTSFPAFTADNTPQLKTVGSSSSTFGLTTCGAFSSRQRITSNSVQAGTVTSGSTSSSSGTSSPTISAYGTWYAGATCGFTAQENNITQFSAYAAYSVSSITCSGSDQLKIWARTRLYDNTVAADVPAGIKKQLLYFKLGAIATNGQTNGIFNANEVFISGFRGLLIPGHSYTLYVELMKEQASGTPTCDLAFVTSGSSSSSATVS
jgi:hypothetical protein